MLTRIVEPAIDAISRMDGLVTNPVIVSDYNGTKVLDYITDLSNPLLHPPGAIYVATSDGIVLVKAPADFTFAQQWGGWDFPEVPPAAPAPIV
jgi:hypothetical protein